MSGRVLQLLPFTFRAMALGPMTSPSLLSATLEVKLAGVDSTLDCGSIQFPSDSL